MRRKKKGFTLIELLAVIVILGLLMAIAIPSVTKYITESRKKTVTSTIGNYVGALVNEVNDLTYTFTGTNTIYAVPIECIALERGGTNPFGEWYQANDNYFAYVLVQYDDDASSYIYGYTFKDSAGYGLYPTSQSKLNEKGKQIKTGLDIKRPTNGTITNITAVDNWNGFDVDSTTDLVVLEAASEGEVGDGKTTCTLQQKGANYEQVEKEKAESETPIEPEQSNAGASFVTYDDNDVDVFLTWEELKKQENGEKYGYNASAITDTEIGVGVFELTQSMISITLPDGITTIGDYSFYGIGGEDRPFSITIPASVTSIGSYALNWNEGWGSVELNITYKGTKAQWNAIQFGEEWYNDINDFGEGQIVTIICTDGTITLN